MSFKFNIFSGTFDIVGQSSSGPSANNFSYIKIPQGKTVVVPQNEQMLFVGPITIDGTLRVIGEIRDMTPQESFYGWRVIPIDKVVVIPSNRQMLFTAGMRILGSVRVQGELKETGFL